MDIFDFVKKARYITLSFDEKSNTFSVFCKVDKDYRFAIPEGPERGAYLSTLLNKAANEL